MRIIGIDYGDSRIGIAVSDPLGWTAQAIETINWKNNIEEPIERISEIINSYQAKKVIVGFPKNMNGTIGPRGEKTNEFIELLNNRVEGIEIIKWDERLSTVAANRAMNVIGVKKSKKRQVVDQIAAVYILQGYLDAMALKN
ncbi:MAG: Holliday junction resolvase RuvX [Clostridiaceae bacterium]|jgi:putative Holliday junction resolvase|nr:Holliday junction resolvase RuvX [Clostridiaceae bacterium]